MIVETLTALGLNVLSGDMIGSDYCHDEYPGDDFMPDAVVEAISTEQVAAVLKTCSEAGVPVTVRGAGTGQMGGSVPVKGGVVLSTKALDKVLAYHEEDRTLQVQAGVLLQDVKEEAEKHGMYYPPDPAELMATIGGNVATNAGGPNAVKYGKTKDYVVDGVVVLADGTIERLADRSELIGSEGTLAVLCEVTLRVIEKPGADMILLFPFLEHEAAFRAADQILQAGFEPSVVEYMDTDLVEFSGNITGDPVFPVEIDGERVAATLMVTIEGNDDDHVMEKLEAIAEMAEELECMDILVGNSNSMKKEFWTAHGAFHTSVEKGAKSACEVNIDVPAGAVSEMAAYAKEIGAEKGMGVLIYAHAGSGGMHIHMTSALSKEALAPVFKDVADAVYTKCMELNGRIAGEYGIGYGKAEYLSKAEKDKFSAIKATYDPTGCLNPGKIC